jgi:hypothetical protein
MCGGTRRTPALYVPAFRIARYFFAAQQNGFLQYQPRVSCVAAGWQG